LSRPCLHLLGRRSTRGARAAAHRHASGVPRAAWLGGPVDGSLAHRSRHSPRPGRRPLDVPRPVSGRAVRFLRAMHAHRSRWWLPAAWIVLLAVALAVRLPLVLRVGPTEGGADEWYAVWHAWGVLFERGNPGNFLRPALFYDAGAALFSGLYVVGRQSGA